MDYNLFVSSYCLQDGSSSINLNVYGIVGINVGVWCLCSDYQFNKIDSEDNYDQLGGILCIYFFCLLL